LIRPIPVHQFPDHGRRPWLGSRHKGCL
jgi:hypothetical protein